MKNIKCLLVAIAAFISFCEINAQSSGKAVLGIEEFSYDSSFSETDVEVCLYAPEMLMFSYSAE